MSPRRKLVAVLIAFAITRMVAGYVADNPDLYDGDHINAVFEISNYHNVGQQMLEGSRPYEDFKLEYPPGELPFLVALAEFEPLSFQAEFVLLCILADALGLWAVYRLARRTGSWWGVLAWLVLIPALGPLSYSRTDIFVAVAIAWTFERAHAGRWTAAGAWVGIGIAVKLTPALLLPALLLVCPERKKLLTGCGFVVGIATVPFFFQLPGIWHDVIKYHADRGVQGESLVGSLIVAWRHFSGHDLHLQSLFGSWEVTGPVIPAVKTMSNLAVGAVLVDSVLGGRLSIRRGDVGGLAVLMTGTLTLLVACTRVFSPQYMVWLIGMVAVGLTFAPKQLRTSALLLSAATVLTLAAFPFLFFDYLADKPQGIAVIVLRNVLVLAAGLLAARAAWRGQVRGERLRRADPAVEQADQIA